MAGNPVIIGLKLSRNYFEINPGQNEWLPGRSLEIWHAMTVVGFCDFKHGGAFQIMNSSGNSWGDKGFIWLRYRDFERVVHYGYIVDLALGAKFEGQVPAKGLRALFELRRVTFSGDSLEYKPEDLEFRDTTAFYESRGPGWRVGDYYELAIAGLPQNAFLYLFSLDGNNRINLLYYAPGQPVAFPGREGFQIIPGRDQGAFQFDTPGQEYFFVLISNFEITDVNERLNRVRAGSGSIMMRLRSGFPECVQPGSVYYEFDDMMIEHNWAGDEPSIVPLLIKFQVKE